MAKFRIPYLGEFNVRIPIYDKMKEVKRRSENTKRRYEHTKEMIVNNRQELQNTLELYGRTKAIIYDNNIRNFVTLINRIKDYEVSMQASKMEGRVININFKEIKTIDFNPIDILKATLAGGGTGAVTAAVTYAGVGALASASTGVAITTLNGIAATNATLAWLGGGSLASGGFGMAAGTAVLGGLVAIPALVVGGLIMDKKLNKILDKVEEKENIVNQFVKEWKIAIERMEEIKVRTDKLHKVLNGLDSKFYHMVNELEFLIESYYKKATLIRIYDEIKEILGIFLKTIRINYGNRLMIRSRISYSKFIEEDKSKFERILTTAMIIKRISDVELINTSGQVSENSKIVLKEAKEYLRSLGK